MDEQKPPVGSERCMVGTSNTPDPTTPIAYERRASSHAGSASICRSCLCATNWYRGGMRCHEHWEPVLQYMIAERQWEQKAFFLRLWQAGLQVYDELEGIQWEWQAVDGAMTKAPLGKAATGANPTDRGKKGTKRSLLTDGAGIPLAMVIDGANRHDVRTAVRDPGWHRHCPFRAAPSSGLSISVWTRAMMGHQHTRRSRLATTSHLFAAVERRNRRKSLPLAIGRDAG